MPVSQPTFFCRRQKKILRRDIQPLGQLLPGMHKYTLMYGIRGTCLTM